jgi:membrane-associated phospholipid phosphatase
MPSKPAADPGGRLKARIQPHDWIAFLYLLTVATLILSCRDRIPGWGWPLSIHAGLLAMIIVLITRDSTRPGGFASLARSWDALLYVPISFVSIIAFIHLVHPHDYDSTLQEIDRYLGGDELLRWTMTWSSPAIDEAAKWCWVSYYILPIVPMIPLYLKSPRAFQEAKTILVATWLLSYLGYFAVPAQGPLYFKDRLGITDPSAGIAAAGALKEIVHSMEGDARDTFPSGHTAIAAAVIVICLRNRLALGAVAVPLAAGVIASTLVLRYHYLVDVLAGLALALLCTVVGLTWHRRIDGSRLSA